MACAKLSLTAFCRRFAAVALILLSATASFSLAAEVDGFNDVTARKVTELSKTGGCKQAWNIIWPQVLVGSNRATIALVGEMTWGNIQPPLMQPIENSDVSQQEILRFAADLVFLIDPTKVQDLEEIASIKREFLSQVWSKEEFSKYEFLGCPAGGDRAVCLDPRKWTTIVSNLSDWNKKFESNEEAGLMARCRGING